MKRFALVSVLTLLSFSMVRADTTGQEQVSIKTCTSSSNSSGTLSGDRSVTFIFHASFAGTIAGNNQFTSADVPLKINAESGDTLGPITYTVTAGTLLIVEAKRK
jgi:hypothetical protein